MTTEGGYLLPVTISSIEGNNLDALSSNRGVVYVKIQNIHVNVESGQPAEGTLIADRSGWTVKVAPTTRGDAKNLIDGTNSDVARDGGAEYWLTVDIGKVQTLTGIRNKCYASSYSPTAVEVFTSGDGIKWKSIGTVTISRSGTQYIKFSKAIETRYLKYYVKQGPNTVSLKEFDLYALERNRVSGWFGVYGWFAWTDAFTSGGGLAVFAGLAAGYDWHRPLYRTERNAFCWTSQRNISINAAAGVASAYSVSVCVDSGNHCSWNDSPTGAGTGLAGRCKCGHAEPVTRSGAKAVCLV